MTDIGLFSIFFDAPISIESSMARSQSEFTSNSYSMANNSGLFLDLATALFIVDFIFLWVISAVVLHEYSRRIGKSTTFWTVIFLPISFLLVGIFPTMLGFPNADFLFFEKDLVFYRILVTVAGIVTGILFGLSFLILARGIRQIKQKIVADYLKIAGYGIILIIISIIVGIVFIPYPPFGIATCAVFTLGSYLFYVGIYSSTILISEDMELRRSIKRAALNELKLLDSIGAAQMRVRLQDNVMRLVKEHSKKITTEAGIQLYLPEEDAKKYLQEVLHELDKHRPPTK